MRSAIALALFAVLSSLMLAAAAPASAALTRKQAAKKALAALGTEKKSNPVIVFGLTKPVRAGTRVTQAGTKKFSRGSKKGLSKKLRSSGVRVVRAPRVATVGRERAFFFYEDSGPYQLYQHPGRVALVGVDSGRVVVSKTITWPPLLGGKLPAFLRKASAYRSSKYRVLYRPWSAPGAPARSANRPLFENDPFGPGKPLPGLANAERIADRLAAEHSCVLRVADTMPAFWDAQQVFLTRTYVGTLFARLELENRGFIDERYGARSGKSLGAAVDALVGRGCRDVLLYMGGAAYDVGGETVLEVGAAGRPGGLFAKQDVTATQLRNLISSYGAGNSGGKPTVTFKLKIDAPYAGGLLGRLSDLSNVLLVETASADEAPAFGFIPDLVGGGSTFKGDGNPAGLLEFTNMELRGLASFFDSQSEIQGCENDQTAGGSFLACMLARAFELGSGDGFADDVGSKPQIYSTRKPNRPPKANQQDVTVQEDTPKGITLTASDDDGDPLTFTITKQPDHGTLSGTAPNVTYTPDANYAGKDDFSFKANDGKVDSNTAKVSIDVVGADDPPVLTTSAGCTSYTEGAAGVAVDGSLTASDLDDANLEGATVRVSANFQPGDDLLFTDQNEISSSYDDSTGVMTLTGTSSVANYQAALRSVRFASSNNNPSASKTIEFKASDGDLDSNAATKQVCTSGVNDAPDATTTIGPLSYTEGDGAVAVDPGFVVGDPDDTNLEGATIAITSNFSSSQDSLGFTNQNGIAGTYNSGTGVLTLTGTSTVANYEAAIRSITYTNGSDDPSTATRTVRFTLNDGSLDSNPATRDIEIAPVNDAPVVTASAGTTSYTEGDPATTVDGALTVTDADDANLVGGQVRISSGFESGDDLVFATQNGITGAYNSGTGVLTLTGTASKADYQTALRSIEFQTSSDDPITGKVVEFKVNDGDADSNLATKHIAVTRVNDAPTLSTTGSALAYTEGDGAVAIDPGLTATDPDSASFQGATVQITSNFVQADDELAFTDTANITGAYNDSTGTLTLSGTASVADYQAALRSVTYENVNQNPSGSKTVSFQATDSGGAASNVATRNIDLSGANDAPVVTTSAGSTPYTEGDPATTVDGALTVTDADDTNLEGGQVRISSGFQSGDDLVFVDTASITGTYNTGTGVLTLTGTASVADYQTALRSIQYRHTGDAPSSSKTVEFKVNDGDTDSNLATKAIAITPVNDAPTLNTTGSALSYTEGDGAVAVDPGITASDPDSASFQGATVQITSNFVQADDELSFTDTANITGAYDDSTGTLTLSGTASVADYQAALRSVTYENVNQNPSGSKTVSFQATDSGGAASNVATRNIDLSGANDAPVVTTSAGSTAYSEGDPATTVDGALTVTDADDTNLMGGQVRLSTGFESGDDLVFVNQNGISGSYDTGTGVLTLTGTASVADYQTALRSIQYQHTGDNPQGTKTVEFKVNDGDVDSNLALKTINITGVNDAPALTTTAAALSYTEGDGAVAIDPGLTAADPDSANFQGATVQITSNFVQADDELAFVDQNGITGAYNDSTGTLTLSGTASRADYQAALRSVTYENSNDNPSGSKTVSFQATDSGGAASNVATRNIDLSGANDAPVVTTSAGDTSYTEGDPATTVDGALTVTDADDTNLEGGQVRISSGFQSGDDLVFVNQNGISGSYNSGTGVLTLAGTASKADYQTALRSIQYRHTGDAPSSSKTVEFKVNDGDADSNLATKGIAITPVNDAPTLTTTAAALSYTEGDGAVAVDSGLTAADPDSANFQGATVQITGNFVQADDELAFTNTANITGVYNDSTGTLTLSGTDTVANYQAALRSVTYESTSNNPSGSKTVSFQATDSGGAASNVATRDINLSGANDAPVVTTSAGSTPYSEGDPATTVDGALTVTDADDTNLEGGQVRISSGFQSGDDLVFVNQNGISGVYNTGTGVLTLTGTASVADYQTALRSIMFQTTNDNPSSPKTVEFKVNDGDVDSNLATKNVAITGANDAPTLTTTAAPLAYTEGDGAVAIDTGLTATDPDSASFQGATVQITSNFVQADDELSFINQNGISGSYDDSTGTLTLSGTASVADYQAALRSVGYTNSSDNPSGSKTVSFQATDSGGAASNVATRNINLTGANDAPVVTTSGGDTAYTEGGAAATVDGALTVTDADDTNLEGGQVRISSGFQSGDDLVFVNQNGISGSYNTGTGVLTLTGTASKADYQTALRSIQFQTTNDNPSSPKTVEFKVNDGDADSNLATKNVVVTGSNDAPTVNTTGAALSYTEGDGAVAVDSGLTVTDPDSTNLSGATVQITGNFVQADDELAFTNQNGISGSYDDSTGTLTLSGTASVANYQTALRSVTYENVNQNPSGSKTVSFQVTDSSSAASNVATRNINLTGANDAPVVTTSAGSTAYTEGDPATTIDGALTVTDADDTNLEGGVVRISSGFQSGDDLVFVNQNGISGVYNTGTGVLTLSGTSSVANYQTALRSIKFQSTNNAPVTSKTVEFKVNDGDVDSNAPTKEIAVTPVNSPPTVDATNAALSYTENDPATAVDSGLTITEPEGDNLSGGSASITANYQAGQDFLAWTDNNLADNITLDNVNSNAQTVVLTGVDTPANYQAALRAVTYQNGSENPSNLTRTVTFSATDTPGGATGSDTRSIAVTPVDDPPDAVNDSATVLEDAAATSIPVLTNDTDIDGGPKTISSATDPANGTVVLTGGSPGAHTGLTYQPDPNYCNDPPGNTPDTFQYTVNGGDSAFVSITVTCVNDAPVADDETFNGANSAVGNTTFVGNDPDDAAPATPDPTDTNPGADRPHKTITGDILAGDTDVDGPGPLTVTPGTFATNDGGSVTIESDGDFTYEPASSTSCTDTSDFFDYTVEDSGSPEQTDTGRVTIAIANCVWYVNNNDAQGNSGTSAAPFDTTQMAETASGAGHFIHVQDGNNTTLGYTTGLNMKANQSLVGEASALVVGGDTLQEADASKRPQLTDALEDVVALDDGNTVTGIEVDPTGANSGIAGASGDTGGGTISNDRIIDTGVAGTAPNLELDSTTGTFSVSDLTVNNTAALGQTSGSTGVRLNSAGTVSFAPTGTISINTTGSKGLDAVSTGLGTSTFDDITVAGSTVGGVRLDTTTGTVGLGDGTGTDLSLTTTSGSEAGLRVNSHTGGGLTVDSAGTDDVHATGGPAVDVTGTSGPTLSFDDVDSTNSGNDGINLDGLGTGTFSATSGDVTGSAGISFDLNGGSGAITYPATFGNGSGTTAIEITGRSGGVVSLSGSISDTNDTGGGVNVASNTGGSTVLSGPTKQFNTTSADAVVFSASDGHTFVLSGGGTDIDTSSGKGLDASTSGTIQVSGSGNTLDSSALSVNNRALNISDTDIAAADVTFQRVSSSGGANGIRLNNTGSAGNLAVTGVGGTCTNADTSGCSGGQIQNTTGTDDSSATPIGTGIVLNNTQDPTLTRVWLHDHSNYGIRGSAVTNFTLANSVINGTNGTNDGGSFEDSSVRFQNASGAALQGSASVTNTHIQGGFTNNFQVTQTAGNLNRITFNSDTIGPNSTTNGNDGIRVQGTGTSTTNVTVLNSALTSARGDLFQLVADGSGGGDLDFESNTVSNNHPAIATGSGGVAINGGAAGPFSLNIHGTNTFRDSLTNALTIQKSLGTGSMTGTIDNADIGLAGTANSGSVEGSGIELTHGGGGTATVSITNNDIRQYNNFGVSLVAGVGIAQSGNFNVTATGNTIANPGNNPSVTGFQGFALNSGVAAGDSFTSCLNLKGNTLAGSAVDAPATDIRVRARQNTTVRLPGYGGSATDTTAVASFLANQNDANPNDPAANPPVPTSSAAKDATSAGFTGTGTTCP